MTDAFIIFGVVCFTIAVVLIIRMARSVEPDTDIPKSYLVRPYSVHRCIRYAARNQVKYYVDGPVDKITTTEFSTRELAQEHADLLNDVYEAGFNAGEEHHG